MSNLKIYQLEDGVSTPFPNVDSQIEIFDYTYNAKRMGGAPTISATVKFATCLDDVWTGNVYVEFKGEKYFLKQTPTSSYSNDDARYKHELELVSERIILDNVYFYDVVSDQDEYKPVTNSSKVAFFGTIHEFAQRMNHSLQYAKLQTYVNGEIQGYHVIVDDGVESEGKLITFEDQYFSNVLQEIYNVYELPYYFIGKEIHIGFKDSELSQTFQYGLNNELLSITKTNANAMVVNRATGQGSTDNIPYYYPNMSEKGDMQAVLHSTRDGVVVTENVTIINGEKYGKLFNPTDTTSTVGESLTYHQKQGTMEYMTNSYKYVLSKEGVDSSDYTYVDGYPVSYKFPQTNSKITFKFQRKIKVTEEGEFTISAAIYQYDANGVFSNNTFNAGNVVNIQLKNIEIGETYHTYVEVVNSVAVGFKTNDVIPVGEYLFSFDYNVPYQGYITTGNNSYATKLELGNIVSPLKQYWYAEHADKYYTRLSEAGLRLQDGTTPKENDVIIQEKIGYIQPQETLMPPIYRESEGDERFYNALNETYEDENGEYVEFPNPYVEGKPKEVIVEFEDIKPTIVGIKNKASQEICKILDVAFDTDDNNETEEIDGTLEYKHPYFFVKLAKTDGEHPFNIFDSAIDEGEMTMAMTSGHCGGCEFTIMVSDDDLKMNAVQVDDNGNLVRDSKGNVLCGRKPYQPTVIPQDRQNNTIDNEVWVALKKDEQTFGRMMPEGNIKPVAGDTFVLLHIFLPQAYIKYAEDRLEQELIKYIKENNDEKFTFSIKFSRIYLAENPDIANAITENAVLQVTYNGYTYPLYVSSYSYKVSSNEALPEITVELKDEISVNQNAIQNAITEVKGDFLHTFENLDIIGLGQPYFLRKDINDRSAGQISASLGFEAGGYEKGRSGAKIDEYGQAEFENVTSRDGVVTESITTPNFSQGLVGGVGGKFWVDDDGKVNLEVDNITARQSLTVMELILQEVKSVGGELVVSASNGEIESITAHYTNGDYTDGSNVADMTNVDHYTIKLKDDAMFMNGDLIRCSQWDMANNSLRSYWVQFYPQTDANGATGNTGIVYASDFASGIAPQVGDKLVQMGNVSNTERQGVIIISALNNKPYISVYDNVSQPNIQSANLKGRFGDLSGLTFDGKTLSGYGIWSDNVYLKGELVLSNGNRIGETDNSDRNLLLGTNQQANNWFFGTDIPINYEISYSDIYNTYRGIKITNLHRTGSAAYEVLCYPLRPALIVAGEKYHLSFDIKQSEADTIPIVFNLSICNKNYSNFLVDIIVNASTVTNMGVWQHCDIEFTPHTSGTPDGEQVVYLAVANSVINEWSQIEIVNLKLERNYRGTVWSAAPEDGLDLYKTETNTRFSVVEGEITSAINTSKQYTDGQTEILSSQIRQTSDSISLAVESIKSGGRNLLENTNRGATNWQAIATNAPTLRTYSQDNEALYARFAVPTSTPNAYSAICYDFDTSLIKYGQKYTLQILLIEEGLASLPAKIGLDINLISGGADNRLGGGYMLPTKIEDNGDGTYRYIFTFEGLKDGQSDGQQKIILFLYNDSNEGFDSIIIAKNLQLEYGEIATDYGITNEELARRTGLDIYNGRIIVTTDTFIVQNANGKITSQVDAEGNLSSNAILCYNPNYQETASVDTDNSETSQATGAKYIVTRNEHKDGWDRWYYPNGNLRAEMGWDDGTQTLIRYYNEDGSIAWGIGNPANFMSGLENTYTAVKLAYIGGDVDTANTAAKSDRITLSSNYFRGGDGKTYEAVTNGDTTTYNLINGYFTDQEYPMNIGFKDLNSGVTTWYKFERRYYLYANGVKTNSFVVRWNKDDLVE